MIQTEAVGRRGSSTGCSIGSERWADGSLFYLRPRHAILSRSPRMTSRSHFRLPEYKLRCILRIMSKNVQDPLPSKFDPIPGYICLVVGATPWGRSNPLSPAVR